MQKFGEMRIATFKDNTHFAKLANQGTPGILLGYDENHPAGTYRIFNPKTKHIILTRDVTFLKQSYGEYSKVEKPVILHTTYEVDNKNININVVSDCDSDSSDDGFENNEENFFDEDIDDHVIASLKTTINAMVIQAMKKL